MKVITPVPDKTFFLLPGGGGPIVWICPTGNPTLAGGRLKRTQDFIVPGA